MIYIQIDTLRMDHTSLSGDPRHDGVRRDTTPFLRAFATRGILFTQAVSPATWCASGTVTMMTALYPSSHGVVNKFTFDIFDHTMPSPLRLPPSIKTLPELLKAHGYRVVAFTGQQTIDLFADYHKRFELHATGTKFATFPKTVPAALGWLKANKDRKFFLALHGYDPHGAVDPPGGHRRVFDPDYRGPYRGTGQEYRRLFVKQLEHKEARGTFAVPGFTPRDGRFYKALYDERIRNADAQIKVFLEEVERLGLLDRTIVAIVSDHGEEFLDHGGFAHGHTLYEEMVRVPMMLVFPGSSRGKVIPSLVRNFDLLPTIFDALRIPLPPTDGTSLLPLLSGNPQDLVVYPETDFLLHTKKRGVRTGRYKLIHTVETGEKELYDLRDDPGERHNLYRTRPDEARRLEDLLERRPGHPQPKGRATSSPKGRVRILDYW